MKENDSNIVQENEDQEEELVFCRRCGRPLRGIVSKSRQFGPSCYRVWVKERSQQINLFEVGENCD